jgi:hypothetical protein
MTGQRKTAGAHTRLLSFRINPVNMCILYTNARVVELGLRQALPIGAVLAASIPHLPSSIRGTRDTITQTEAR